jgi:RNA polymerase sigma-32 factor
MRIDYPTSDVAGYLRAIHRFPLLEAAEEASLAKRWRDNADREAAHRILTSHLRLVPNVARRYRGYGLPLFELISEGNLGLMQAARRFDPSKGARFSTYAVWWIKAAIQEYILRSWSLVRIGTTNAQRRLFFNLRQLKCRIAAVQQGGINPEHAKLIAKHLRVGEREVVDMNQRLEGDVSLNTAVRNDSQVYEWQDRLVDGQNQEDTLVENDEFVRRQQALRAALGTLGDRERYVFEMRRLADEPRSLDMLALELGISSERVRQIEARAFEKVCRTTRGDQSLGRANVPQIASMNRPAAGAPVQRSSYLLSREVAASMC